MNNNVERQIDIKKYFVHLLRFWWLAVLLAVLCGAALGGFKYMKDKKAYEELGNKLKQDAEEVVDIEKRIEEAKETLNVVERQNVELAVEYYRLMQQYTKYKNSSVYLSQNPYKVNRTTLYYMVDLDESVEGEFEELQILKDNIVQAYVNYINTGAFSSEVADKVELDAKYVVELVTADKNGNTAYGQNYFKIMIINDENMEDMRDEIEDCVTKYGTSINDTLAKHSLVLVDEYNSIAVDNVLINDIQGVQTDIYNASTRLAALKKAFNEKQLMCYNDAIGVLDVIETEQDNMGSGDGSSKAPSETITEAHIQKKYVVIGMLLGLVIYCCIILARFLFTAYILAESGFQSMFGLRYLGKLSDNNDEDMLGMTAMKICLACRKDKVDRLAIISSEFANVSEEGIEALVNRLNKENIEVVKLERALVDGKSMSELFDIGRCVLAERTGKTKLAKLSNLVDLCNENSIGIYGVVDL